jgi:hypothetical protein
MELSGGVAAASSDARVHAAFPLDVTAKPLGVAESMWDRSFDVGVGYRFVPTTGREFHHGPTASLSYVVPISMQQPLDGESEPGLRFLFTGQSQLVLGNEVDDVGIGATFRFTSEWAGYSSGPFDGCETQPDAFVAEGDDTSCAFGHSFGEVGLGLFAEASYLELSGRPVGWVGFGLSFRIPAAIGIAIASVLD